MQTLSGSALLKDDNRTTDEELVELSGHHAYKRQGEDTLIIVNDKTFEVIDTIHNPESDFRSVLNLLRCVL